MYLRIVSSLWIGNLLFNKYGSSVEDVIILRLPNSSNTIVDDISLIFKLLLLLLLLLLLRILKKKKD